MDMHTGIHIMTVLSGLISISLYIIAFTYITKLERINCPCAEHPYRKWIKALLIFSIIFVGVNIFVPLLTYKSRDPWVAFGISAIAFIFVALSIAFLFLVFSYVRFLYQSKCQCSEDVRREVVYYWSIIQVVILLISVFALTFTGLVQCSASAIIASIDPLEKVVLTTATDPITTVKALPATFSKTAKGIFRDGKRISRQIASKFKSASKRK